MAQGDNMQRFDQSQMRQHLDLLTCFENQANTPFPQVAGEKISIRYSIHFTAYMQDARKHDSRMVQCDSCDVWFHCKCTHVSPLQKTQTTLYVLHV